MKISKKEIFKKIGNLVILIPFFSCQNPDLNFGSNNKFFERKIFLIKDFLRIKKQNLFLSIYIILYKYKTLIQGPR